MFDTQVENIFINEHLVSATGEQIKVFLMGLMYAEIGMDISDEDLAQSLGVDLSVVLEAWRYWIKKKVVRRRESGIEFLNLKERVYGDNHDCECAHQISRESGNSNNCGKDIVDKAEKQTSADEFHPLIDRDLLNLFSRVENIVSRPLNHKERELIADFVLHMNASSEIVAYGFKYSYDRDKKSVEYIRKVIQDWVHSGYRTEEDVEKEISKYDQRFHVYKRIMRALGFSRMPSEAERQIMDNWMELGVAVGTMVEACGKTAGISNPNIKYVDKIILGDLAEKKETSSESQNGQTVSRKQIVEYVEKLREDEEEAAKERIVEIENKIPEIAKLRERSRKNIMELASVSGDSQERNKKIELIRKENEKIRESINSLLHKNNIPVDYMEIRYKCRLCKDNLFLDDGSQCRCFLEREKELRATLSVEDE